MLLIFVGVRLDRVRGGRQKYKRTIDSGPIVQQIFPMIKKACIETTKSGTNDHKRQRFPHNILHTICLYALCHRHLFTMFFVLVDFSSDNKVLSQLISIEHQLDKLYVNTESEVLEGGEEVRFLATVSDLADRELVITISWAKQVPGRCHQLHI